MMISEAEIGLAEADDCIAEADRNIREIQSLIPQLVDIGYPTTEVENHLGAMTQALQQLHARRRAIVETLDRAEPPPRIARPSARARRQSGAAASPPATRAVTGIFVWRALHRLTGS